ncbi:Protease-like protein [Kitasatospora sp. MMS16-BH015]|nr:peptidase S8 [Kitasatospora sp. MMS16-BH015]AUG82001.1 Protease-like protein [Kitasatospora sp. MMS16-BH015]
MVVHRPENSPENSTENSAGNRTGNHPERRSGRTRPRTSVAAYGAAALLAGGLSLAAPAGAADPHATGGGRTSERSCAAPTAPGVMACHALRRTDVTQPQEFRLHAVSPTATPAGYGPADLLSAYTLPGGGGAGTTVAIVDAYDDPNAEADLAVYRAQYGLPACTTANGCFRKINQNGGTSYPAGNTGWGSEISLDLDMVSAIAPNAHILLVEAGSATIGDLGTSVNQAVAQGAKYVSNSYGGGESATQTAWDVAYFNHPGVVVTVSSGDSGYGVQYPAASPFVTAVGGTSLSRASNARGWTESAWSGAGSGCSAYEGKPGWQTDGGCPRRTVADVSAVADPATGVAVYDTYGSPGWQVFGGTSVAAPVIAAVYADAGTPGIGSYPSSYPYARTYALYDVSGGSNGSCSPAYLCGGGSGYDGPTGLGSPDMTNGFTNAAQRVVSLRAHANNDYVTAENAGASPLIANRTAIGQWEQFDLIPLGGTNVALRAHADNRYVTAENAGAAALIANRTAIAQWETFQLVTNADGSVSLLAAADNQYVTAENAGASALIANRTAIGPWEEFDLIG